MFNESFRNNPNITKIAHKVFLYKNFITGDLLEKINSRSKDFVKANKVGHNVDWYHSRVSPLMPELFEVWEKASELIYPELVMHPQSVFLVSRPEEEGMFIHSDAPGEPHEDCGSICGTCDIAGKKLISEDRWNTCCRLHYGLIIYFGDWEGGEIFYPHVNSKGEWIGNNQPLEDGDELKIKPENGDLVIHGAHNDYAHGTYAVTKGHRLAFSNFVLPAHTNPGTFYNYKTEEYFKQTEKNRQTNDLSDWLQPINGYVFQDPPEVIEEKNKGIWGVRYR